jgi:hypothetical protein
MSAYIDSEFLIFLALALLTAWRIAHQLTHEKERGDAIHTSRTHGGRGFREELLDSFYASCSGLPRPSRPLFQKSLQENPLHAL